MQANDLRLKILLLVLVGSADRPTVERSFRQAFATPPLFHAISWQKLLSQPFPVFTSNYQNASK